MSANVVKVNGNYKIKAVQGGQITLDAGLTGDVIITGNLTVTGGTTTLTTNDTYIKDNVIFLNDGESHTKIFLGYSGISIDRGEHPEGNGQFYFQEDIQWNDPWLDESRHGLFVFQTEISGVCAIRTNVINTGGLDLILIGDGSGVVSVSGTVNYETNVLDDDDIPNKKYVDSLGNVGKVVISQPATTATLTIDNNKTLRVSNTLTFNGYTGSAGYDTSNVNFTIGGTVAYKEGDLTQFASTAVDNFRAKISGTSGTGNLVFNSSPAFSTPSLGNATASSINKLSITQPATTATLTIDNNKSFRVLNSLRLSGTDNSDVNFTTGGTVAYKGLSLAQFPANTTSSADLKALISDETGSGSLVFSDSPSLSRPYLGDATANTFNNLSILFQEDGAGLSISGARSLSVYNTVTLYGSDGAGVDFRDGGSIAYLEDVPSFTITESQISDLQTYLTVETDPVFTASEAFDITSTNKTNWNTAYGWGNHANAGYLGSSSTVPDATNSSTAKSVGYLGMPQQSKSAPYTTTIADSGKHIYVTSSTTITIDSNANVPYPIGASIAFIAAASVTVTINITSDTMYLGGPGTTGTRTLAPFGMATAVKVESTKWFINGIGLT